MKEITIRDQICKVDDEDYSFLIGMKWYISKGYAMTTESRKMHRIILQLSDPKVTVDHIDGDKLNNQKSNLRCCSQGENTKNRSKVNTPTSSRYKGVYLHRGKWAASIRVDYKRIYLGRYNNEDEAALAYNKAAVERHGDFAKLNIII